MKTFKLSIVFLLITAVLITSLSSCDNGIETVSESDVSEAVSNDQSRVPTEESEDDSSVDENDESDEIYIPDTNPHGAFRLSCIDDTVGDDGKRV